MINKHISNEKLSQICILLYDGNTSTASYSDLRLLSNVNGGGKIIEDLRAFKHYHHNDDWSDLFAFFRYMARLPEYRYVFYFRLPILLKMFLCYVPPLRSFHITTPSSRVGGGLHVSHGWFTGINAEEIGRNCCFYQHVTVGSKDRKVPILEDDVVVTCHAVVLGGIRIGAGSQIGSNAVVVKDVPANSVVVPAKSVIIKQNGQRCIIPL